MQRIKIYLVGILIVFITYTVGVAAQSILINSEEKNILNEEIRNTKYDAMITFYIYEGEGCSCIPLVGAYINATSSEGPEYNLTDEEGMCVLPMVINIEYRVTIEAEDYHLVKFDFNVVEDQTFKFHMGEADDDSSQNLQGTIQIIKELYQVLKLREGINNVLI